MKGAEILNKAAELKKLREEADRKTEELIPTIFHEMFGDSHRNENNFPTRTLSELVEVKGGGTPSKSHPEFWDGNIPWVSPKDMKQVDISDSQYHITGVAIKSSSTTPIPLTAYRSSRERNYKRCGNYLTRRYGNV